MSKDILQIIIFFLIFAILFFLYNHMYSWSNYFLILCSTFLGHSLPLFYLPYTVSMTKSGSPSSNEFQSVLHFYYSHLPGFLDV